MFILLLGGDMRLCQKQKKRPRAKSDVLLNLIKNLTHYNHKLFSLLFPLLLFFSSHAFSNNYQFITSNDDDNEILVSAYEYMEYDFNVTRQI